VPRCSRELAATPDGPLLPGGLRSDGLDVWPVKCLQERGAARRWVHGLAGGGGLVELGSDVAFEPAELVDERALMGAEEGSGGLDGGEVPGGLAAVQPVPA
jgi:hypothetical protein